MKEEIDHYAVLGLPSSSCFKISQRDITKAYRAKAIKLHPDKRPNDPNSKAKFQRLKQSYDILMEKIDDSVGSKHKKPKEDMARTRVNYEAYRASRLMYATVLMNKYPDQVLKVSWMNSVYSDYYNDLVLEGLFGKFGKVEGVIMSYEKKRAFVVFSSIDAVAFATLGVIGNPLYPQPEVEEEDINMSPVAPDPEYQFFKDPVIPLFPITQFYCNS